MHFSNTLPLAFALGGLSFASASPVSVPVSEPVQHAIGTMAAFGVPVTTFNSWAMSTWSGTSCTGTKFTWTAPDGHSCTALSKSRSLVDISFEPSCHAGPLRNTADFLLVACVANVRSLRVTNLGGCSSESCFPLIGAPRARFEATDGVTIAHYYTDQTCSQSSVQVTNSGCDGYSQGESIGSFSVDC